ncbi:ParA family protein, partial [Salmonella enterica]|uniref:ParA family protein n=1 Tax=Salmonella enterica TaxID=28901 RepID=UPI000ADD7944
DMCPQANLSEILLGGNGTGAANLANLIQQRKTVGGYFDRRTRSPHMLTGSETSFLIHVSEINGHVPDNVFLIAGDPSLEVQAQVINQLSSVNLPVDSWKSIHLWLRDLLVACAQQQGIEETICFIDCNPSFSAYTARAVDNLSQLVYGVGVQNDYRSVNFYDRCQQFGLAVPVIHSLVFNRSTEYDKRASKAFSAMFDEIRDRAENLRTNKPTAFQ